MEDQNTSDELAEHPAGSKRRSFIAIAIGCLLIGVCLYIFAAFFAILWDPAEYFYGVLGFCPGVVLLWFAFRQYRALFSCDSGQSHSFSGCFFVVAFFAFLLVLAIVFGAPRQSRIGDEVRVFAITLIVTVVLGTVSAWNNRRRNVDIPDSLPFGKHPPFLKRYWKRDVVGLFILGAVITGIVRYEISKIPPVCAENVPYEQMIRQPFFPEEGRNFCYIRTGRGTICCEFTIDEQGFRDWIADKECWEYCRPIEQDDNIRILPRSAYKNGDCRWNENEESSPPVVSDGLYAGYGEGKGGRAVFDRSTNRVYFWTYY